MKKLIEYIRNEVNYSQQEMADALDVTFATINRWENGHTLPGKMAQGKLYDFCKEKNINLQKYIEDKIKEEIQTISSEGIILYHGSKSGLVGEIGPKSRERCDFGKGFYMGTDILQPLMLICDFEKAGFYVLTLQMEGLKAVEVPVGLEWAMLVAYNRGKMEDIAGSALYSKYEKITKENDVIIGHIADDRMFYVLERFFNGDITDEALVNSLSALKLGKQYAAVTGKACQQIKVEKEIAISEIEKKFLQDISGENRKNGIELADKICKDYRREGRFFDEIKEEGVGLDGEAADTMV